MRYEFEHIRSFLVLTISGEVSAGSAADRMLHELTDEVSFGNKRVLMDLGGVYYVNSSGIRVLLMALKAVQAEGGTLCLVNLQKSVTKVLSDLKLAETFKRFATLDDALRLCG